MWASADFRARYKRIGSILWSERLGRPIRYLCAGKGQQKHKHLNGNNMKFYDYTCATDISHPENKRTALRSGDSCLTDETVECSIHFTLREKWWHYSSWQEIWLQYWVFDCGYTFHKGFAEFLPSALCQINALTDAVAAAYSLIFQKSSQLMTMGSFITR